MVKLTPVEEVRERFGSKEELAKKVMKVVEKDDDVDDDEFERQILSASNRQLLRLFEVHEIVKGRFGSKEKLVDAIVKLKFSEGNAPYRDKLLTLRSTRLLDLHSTLA